MAAPKVHPPNYMEGQLLRDDLAAILRGQAAPLRQAVERWSMSGITHVYLVGCGGSLATFRPVQMLLERHCAIPAVAMTGWDFVNRAPMRLGPGALVVLASHSGTTEEVLVSLELAKRAGAATLSFSLKATPLSARADVAATYDSIAANLSKLLLGYLLACELIARHGDRPIAGELAAALSELPDLVHTTKEAKRDFGWDLARRYRDTEPIYVLGTGLLEGLAYQFAICNLLEMHWRHAFALNAAEFPHGPLEIVAPGVTFLVLLGTDDSRFVAERARDFIARHGAEVVAIDVADLPGFHPSLAPFAAHLPLQWFNWYLGVERDHPISTRRYMGVHPYAMAKAGAPGGPADGTR